MKKTIKKQYTTPETIFQSLGVVGLVMKSYNWSHPNDPDPENDEEWGNW